MDLHPLDCQMSELSHHFYLLQFFVIIGLLPLSLSPPQPITSQKVRSWSGEQILTFFKKLILAPAITMAKIGSFTKVNWRFSLPTTIRT
jgi:hypothetical protein